MSSPIVKASNSKSTFRRSSSLSFALFSSDEPPSGPDANATNNDGDDADAKSAAREPARRAAVVERTGAAARARRGEGGVKAFTLTRKQGRTSSRSRPGTTLMRALAMMGYVAEEPGAEEVLNLYQRIQPTCQ